MAKYGIKPLAAYNPATMPVLVAEFRSYIRSLGSDVDDNTLTQYLLLAVEWVESQTLHIFSPRQWLFTLDQFPYYLFNRVIPFDYRKAAIVLPRMPLISVDNFTYVDQNLVTQTYTGYQTTIAQLPPQILPIIGQTWPWANPYGVDAVQITFTAGYSDPTLIPFVAKQAIKYFAAHIYETSLRGGTPIVADALKDMPYGMAVAMRKLKKAGFVG